MTVQPDSDRGEPMVAASVAAPKSRRGGGTKAIFNFFVDVALIVPIIIALWVTAMLRLVFPVPTSADGWRLWGLTYTQWSDVQFFSLCAFVLLALEHVVLHWNWVCGVVATKILRIKTRPDEGVQAIYGVGAFIIVLVAMMVSLFAAMAGVERPPQ